MAVIETTTFQLRADADEDAFLAADKRFQTGFAYQQPGLVRRTTARGRGDRSKEWIVIELWGSVEDADASAARRAADPIAGELVSLVDLGTREVRRYEDLGG